jgi:hypothetical protein
LRNSASSPPPQQSGLHQASFGNALISSLRPSAGVASVYPPLARVSGSASQSQPFSAAERTRHACLARILVSSSEASFSAVSSIAALSRLILRSGHHLSRRLGLARCIPPTRFPARRYAVGTLARHSPVAPQQRQHTKHPSKHVSQTLTWAPSGTPRFRKRRFG